jgi:hypothetical protein
MSGPAKLGVYLILGVIGLVVVLKVLGILLSLLVPLAIVAGIGLVIYGFATRNNSLPGGRRFLP